MNLRKKILISTIVILVVLSWYASTNNNLLAAGQCRSGRGGLCVELAAVIPGLEFIQYDESQGLGGFIASLYVFGLGLVGITAMVMLIYASVLYMTAGDNMTRVGEAKKKISNAMFGLVLAFLSWIILRTINPDLVQSLDIKLAPIQEPASQSTTPPPTTQRTTSATCDPNGPANQCSPPAICQKISQYNAECRVPQPAGSGNMCDPRKQPDSCPSGTECRQTSQYGARCEPKIAPQKLGNGAKCEPSNNRCDTAAGLTCALACGKNQRVCGYSGFTPGQDLYICR